jgi:hypothetical protein
LRKGIPYTFLRLKGAFSMQHILTYLQELDRLYHSDTFAEYEKTWQLAARQIEQAFPGFTIAYAELYNSGISRLPNGSMRHVLVPQQQ